ncbi:MAG: 23S rRNA (adenine(2503)-C(2))-methyltransferase RlmN [bacterium]
MNDENSRGLIHGLLRSELIEVCKALGHPAYRAGQVWDWLYRQHVATWEAMKNVPAALRDALAERYELVSVNHLKQDGEHTGTRKILVGLRDGECVEEVLIPARERRTVCVSSQVGCKFACAFCASGKGGWIRNLEAGEIVEELLLAWEEYGDRPTNIVFMGMGEPFDNYDAVIKAIRIMNDGKGLNIGIRHITISTSGIIPAIDRLAGEGLQVELSVSLHAPNNELRNRLMPVNQRYPVEALIEACARHTAASGRIVTYEYTLIRGVNDTRDHAVQLAKLLKGLSCRVNLIPLSPVDGFEGQPPLDGTSGIFKEVLGKVGVNATYRVSKGGAIDAACGQLRRRNLKIGT